MPPSHAHFNGSVNLADTETVMREIAARVPSGLRRVPDGETGDRNNWIFFQMAKLMQSPAFVPAGPLDAQPGDYERVPQIRLADGVDPADVRWPDLGYADAYAESYATFARLRGEGVLPDGVRFQVEYPTPLAVVGTYVVPEQQPALLGSYEQAMFADVERLLRTLPHSDIAVQWDVATEFGVLEEAFAPGGAQAFDMIVAALARCIGQVPAEVPAGLHLCYGDYGHQHFKQPESLGLQVRLLNAVITAAARPVSFVSFTVPQNERDEAYFAPLSGLAAGPDTELSFALVPYHPAGQAPGTTADQVRFIDAALAASPGGSRSWGVSTECGMGRAEQQDVPALIDLHPQIISAS